MTEAVIYQLPDLLMHRLDVGWTLLLLLTRYGALFLVLPGLTGGAGGLAIRYPAVVLLAAVTLDIHHTTAVPSDYALMATQFACEVLFGALVGTVPLLIVVGASVAGQLTTGAMGLNGAQMFDPTTSSSLSDLSRIYTDLAVVLFLLMNGHHVAIAELAGLNGVVQPGSFVISASGIQVLVDQSARVFQIGVMIASPIIVALFLTNFVMGLMSKVISGFNVFMVSFPLTIGIGFILSTLALPEVVEFLRRHFLELGTITMGVIQ